MLTAELYNWTGHVLMVPRTQLTDALRRPEPKCTGVYLLLGYQNGEKTAYIGESDDVGKRLKEHDLKKDWWDSVIFITTAGNKLNKAHVRYLEARLILDARRIAQVTLDNSTSPPMPSLSEADTAKMEVFLENLHAVLPAVRVDMFIERTRPAIYQPERLDAGEHNPARTVSPRFILKNKKHQLMATAILEGGEFVVEKGSIARLQWESKSETTHSYSQLHEQLKRADVLREEGNHCVFTENYAFASPSAAAALVNGRPSNGTVEWRLETTGETYKEWESQRLNLND